MTLAYDSTIPTDIPVNVPCVMGYIDGPYAWPDDESGWGRFPEALKVRIATRASTPDGNMLDVEMGLATPTEAVTWAVTRRKAGVIPIIYCSMSFWPAVIHTFNASNVPQPLYVIAQWDNDPAIPAGAVGKQFENPPNSGGHYDISNVNQTFISAVTGITGAVMTDLDPAITSPDGLHAMAALFALYEDVDTLGGTGWAWVPKDLVGQTNKLKARLDTIDQDNALIQDQLKTTLASLQSIIQTLQGMTGPTGTYPLTLTVDNSDPLTGTLTIGARQSTAAPATVEPHDTVVSAAPTSTPEESR